MLRFYQPEKKFGAVPSSTAIPLILPKNWRLWESMWRATFLWATTRRNWFLFSMKRETGRMSPLLRAVWDPHRMISPPKLLQKPLMTNLFWILPPLKRLNVILRKDIVPWPHPIKNRQCFPVEPNAYTIPWVLPPGFD